MLIMSKVINGHSIMAAENYVKSSSSDMISNMVEPVKWLRWSELILNSPNTVRGHKDQTAFHNFNFREEKS